MSELANITAAPTEIELGGEKFRMQALTLNDLGEFEDYAKESIMSNLSKGTTGMSNQDRRFLTQQTISTAASISWDSAEAMGMLGSVRGAAKILALSLKHEHDVITPEKIISLAGNAKVMKKLAQKLMLKSSEVLGVNEEKLKEAFGILNGTVSPPSS